MALAALDYYFAGVPIPAYKREHFAPWFVVPPDHHWVADYIAFRLYSSYLEPDFWNVDWFAAGNRASDSELSSSKKNFWFPRLRESIDAGSPVPLGLIRGSSSYLTDMNQNHVVVAYGYDFDPGSGAMRVYVYDNNHRDREITLSSDPSTPHFATSTGGRRDGASSS